MPSGARLCDLGYSRMGIHVADFDGTMKRLKGSGIRLMTEPRKTGDGRSVCFRDPDGVYIVLMENPIPGEAAQRSGFISGQTGKSCKF